MSTLFIASLPALITLYHTYSKLDIDYCLSTCSCMLVLTTRFTMHIYDLDLSIHMCLSQQPSGFRITTRRGVLTSLDPHVQVSELGLTWIFLLWTQLTLRSRQTSCSFSPFLSPPGWLAASPATRERLFVLFILVHLFVFSHLHLSVM